MSLRKRIAVAKLVSQEEKLRLLGLSDQRLHQLADACERAAGDALEAQALLPAALGYHRVYAMIRAFNLNSSRPRVSKTYNREPVTSAAERKARALLLEPPKRIARQLAQLPAVERIKALEGWRQAQMVEEAAA